MGPKLLLLGGDGARSGVPRYISQLAAALADRARITVVSEEDRGGYGFVRDMGLGHRVVEGLASSLHPGHLRRGAEGLCRVLEEERPDIVWANARVTLPMLRWCLRGRAEAEAPAVIATYHGIPFGPGHGAAMSALQHLVERVSLGWGPPEWQVYLTQEDRAAMGALAGGRHRVRVISNGSDLGGFDAAAAEARRGGPIRLVMLTRDAPQKDLDSAARLMAVLPGEVRLDLYGTGTQSLDLRQRFQAILGAEGLGRIEFHGPVGDVRAALTGADGFLMTSRYEGQSLAMLEAMEFGLPVISTEVGGATGMALVHPMMALVALGSPAERKAAAERVLTLCRAWKADPAAQASRIHAAWGRNFSGQAFRGEVRRLWDEVLEERPALAGAHLPPLAAGTGA